MGGGRGGGTPGIRGSGNPVQKSSRVAGEMGGGGEIRGVENWREF